MSILPMMALALSAALGPSKPLPHYTLGALESRVGPERLRGFLAEFYAAHRGGRSVRTADFLQAARRSLGDDAALLQRCVMGPWKDCDAAEPVR